MTKFCQRSGREMPHCAWPRLPMVAWTVWFCFYTKWGIVGSNTGIPFENWTEMGQNGRSAGKFGIFWVKWLDLASVLTVECHTVYTKTKYTIVDSCILVPPSKCSAASGSQSARGRWSCLTDLKDPPKIFQIGMTYGWLSGPKKKTFLGGRQGVYFLTVRGRSKRSLDSELVWSIFWQTKKQSEDWDLPQPKISPIERHEG